MKRSKWFGEHAQRSWRRAIPATWLRLSFFALLLGASVYQLHRFTAQPILQFSQEVSAQSSSLPPLGTFDIWSPVWDPKTTKISSFVGTKSGLYLLVHHLGRGGEVIHLDQDGRILDKIQLHGPGPTTSLTADDSGNFAVLKGRRSERTVLALDSAKGIMLDAPPPRHLENIVIVQGNVFGISESVPDFVDLVNAKTGNTIAQIPREISAPMILFSSGNSQLGVIDRVKAIYYRINLATHLVQTSQIISPKIRKAMDFAREVSSADGKVVGNVISEATSNESGNVFATISPYSDGDVSIIRINGPAQNISCFDLSLPALPELKGKPTEGGYIVPSRIAAIGSRIFLLSQSQFKVVYYQIPN